MSTNTVSRPNSAATTPPTDAPTSRFTDHVADESVLATSTSSRAATLGITAVRAGSKNAAISVSSNSSGYTSHTVDRDRTSSMAKTMTIRATSATIMTRLRRIRSLITPAAGPMKTGEGPAAPTPARLSLPGQSIEAAGCKSPAYKTSRRSR